MENDQAAHGGTTGTGAPESLLALADYLERALDKATSVVMMRHAPNVCTVYLGDPAEPREELKKIGTLEVALADDMLGLTSSGGNDIRIGDQPYRFVRSFTQIDGIAAVVFSA
ncbi:hypothetical protein [Burkholderia sp. Ac-20379]|uniref:hypothetical protein n=1 Tax=Burkholderia sp. Ac-20379 TaxID=2703900 RepID=UPI0019806382|nr:hypothetical protein [Burkholderia sp. Ac-20379]MBN3722835.1 hypothetical protein [Burkholderia sp. Ac-20379]